MKSKVKIITKSARCGIKTYVMTDAENYYVLKSIVYTEKTKVYTSTTNSEDKSTMRVVKYMFEPLKGTYRTIYIDRLYTTMELLIEIYDMLLFDTYGCIKNHTPK